MMLSENNEMNAQNKCKSSLLFKSIYFAGLTEDYLKRSKFRISPICFQLLLTFGVLDLGVRAFSETETRYFIFTLTDLSPSIMSLIIWYYMRHRRKKLTILIRKFRWITGDGYEKRINFLTLLNLCLPIIYSALNTIKCDRPSLAYYFAYGKNISNSHLQIMLISLKSFIDIFIFPGFINMISFLFCELSLKCFNLIDELATTINDLSPKKFGSKKQIDIIKLISKVEDLLNNIQEVFSVPSLLLVIANFLSCMYTIGRHRSINWENDLVFLATDIVFFGLISFISFACVLWTAGGVPLAIKKLNESFYKKARLRLILFNKKSDAKFTKMQKFAFAGSNLFSYRRSTILVFLGSLLTYAFLVINID